MVKLSKRFKKFAFIGIASALAASTTTAGVFGGLYANEKQSIKSKTDSYITEISMVQDELESEKQQNVYLETELESTKKQYDQLKDELESKDEQNAYLNDKLDTTKEQNDYLKEQLNSEKEQNHKVENENKYLINQIKNLGNLISDNTIYNFTDNGVTYSLKYQSSIYNLNDNGFTIYGIDINDQDKTSIVIPSSYKGLPIISISSTSPRINYGSNKYIEEITISEGVLKIRDNAFMSLDNLKTVNIPDSIKEIQTSAFINNHNLENINVSQNNQNYSSNNGVLFSKDKSTLLRIPEAICKETASYSIPDYVIKIKKYAFYNCYGLQNISIPSSVAEIEDQALYCRDLMNLNVDESNKYFSSENGILFNKDKSVLLRYPEGKTENSYSIPNSVKIIGIHAFYNCANLQNISIPNGIKIIDNAAFLDCVNLQNINIPNSVTEIGNSAFQYCRNLQSISVPDGVTKIDSTAFNRCSKLQQINVHENNKYFSSENGVLFNKDKSTLIRFPEGKIETSYSIPDSVETIDYGAFNYCTSLQSINIPDSVEIIGHYAFYSCRSLQSINIPDSVKSINNHTFSGCLSLQSINIPDSVESIGYSTFENCRKLQNITITETTKNNKAEKICIGQNAFQDANIQTIYIPEGFDINLIIFVDGFGQVVSIPEVLKDVEIVVIPNENTKDSLKDSQIDPESNEPQM